MCAAPRGPECTAMVWGLARGSSRPPEHVAPVCAVSKVFQTLAEYQKWNILYKSTHLLYASSREETMAPSPPRTLPGVCRWG